MEKEYLLDTNILIYFLNDQIPKASYQKVKDIIKESFNVSIITKLELLGWNKYTQEEFEVAKKFIANAHIIYLDDIIVEGTVELMRKNKLDLADAIIAVSAITNSFILVTRNLKDFNNIDNLEIYNPFNM